MIINTNLEKEFNLASSDDESEEQEESIVELQVEPITLDHYKQIDKIEAALPQVTGLDASDQEFDELADYGLKAHKELMEYGMNIEQRFAGDVLSVAGNMLAHAITAKTNKAKKKLDMIALQIKKQVADHRTEAGEPAELSGNARVFDRNEILQQLLHTNPQNSDKA